VDPAAEIESLLARLAAVDWGVLARAAEGRAPAALAAGAARTFESWALDAEAGAAQASP
jgi:hypothetical protein